MAENKGKKINKERALGADAALISVYKMLKRLEDSDRPASIALSDAIVGVIELRSAIATEYLKEYRRVDNGRN